MKLTARSALLLFTAIVFLLLGLLDYLFFRPGMIFFQWINIERLKFSFQPDAPIDQFLKNYFSDMAWCTALCLVAAALSNKLFNFGKLIILSIPFLTETAQYFSLVPGVFDWYDLLWYMVTICGFAFYFPNITPFNMKKVTSNLVAVAIAGAFLAMAFACATTGKTAYRKPVPQPCVKHQPLNYSPILVKVNLGGSYTMTDLAEAQRTRPAYIVNALNALTYNKYQLADGVTPNLSLTITVTTDSYGHYGAEINGSVYDGTFYNSIPSNYITFEKLYDDIAAKVNVYMTRGWCKNCPDPCVIN